MLARLLERQPGGGQPKIIFCVRQFFPDLGAALLLNYFEKRVAELVGRFDDRAFAVIVPRDQLHQRPCSGQRDRQGFAQRLPIAMRQFRMAFAVHIVESGKRRHNDFIWVWGWITKHFADAIEDGLRGGGTLPRIIMHPGKPAVGTRLAPQMMKGKVGGTHGQRRHRRRPGCCVLKINRPEVEQQRTLVDSVVMGIREPVGLHPLKYIDEMVGGFRRLKFAPIHQQLHRTVFVAGGEIHAGFFGRGEQSLGGLMHLRIVRLLGDAVPVGDDTVDAGEFHLQQLAHQHVRIGRVVQPDQRMVMRPDVGKSVSPDHRRIVLLFVTRPVASPRAAFFRRFIPRHVVHQHRFATREGGRQVIRCLRRFLRRGRLDRSLGLATNASQHYRHETGPNPSIAHGHAHVIREVSRGGCRFRPLSRGSGRTPCYRPRSLWRR